MRRRWRKFDYCVHLAHHAWLLSQNRVYWRHVCKPKCEVAAVLASLLPAPGYRPFRKYKSYQGLRVANDDSDSVVREENEASTGRKELQEVHTSSPVKLSFSHKLHTPYLVKSISSHRLVSIISWENDASSVPFWFTHTMSGNNIAEVKTPCPEENFVLPSAAKRRYILI